MGVQGGRLSFDSSHPADRGGSKEFKSVLHTGETAVSCFEHGGGGRSNREGQAR